MQADQTALANSQVQLFFGLVSQLKLLYPRYMRGVFHGQLISITGAELANPSLNYPFLNTLCGGISLILHTSVYIHYMTMH